MLTEREGVDLFWPKSHHKTKPQFGTLLAIVKVVPKV